MELNISETPQEMGGRAADHAARLIAQALDRRNEANIVVATGASQIPVLDALVDAGGIDWPRVTGFHLDEYVGLPIDHPASFRGYLRQRLVDRVPIGAFHYVNGEAADPEAECERLAGLIGSRRIDVALIGIGENGHIAFNDPPANFEKDRPYLVVELDERCRRQQVGEGWFDSIDEVPGRAITMSPRQILKAEVIICSVPDQRKAEAVRSTVEGEVTPSAPASILQRHAHTTLYLDQAAASQLSHPVGRGGPPSG